MQEGSHSESVNYKSDKTNISKRKPTNLLKPQGVTDVLPTGHETASTAINSRETEHRPLCGV